MLFLKHHAECMHSERPGWTRAISPQRQGFSFDPRTSIIAFKKQEHGNMNGTGSSYVK